VAVTTEVLDRVIVVRIDREEKRNAIDAETTMGIDAALNRLDDDPQLWVGVLTGTKTVFSAGTDLKDGAGGRTERGGEYGVIRRRRLKPLIAAVEGIAFGGGFEIALACDLVVAASTARFALPETRRGLVATSGALFRVIRALPLHVAKELLITGAELSGERAGQLGVVNRVTEPGGALQCALALAGDICLSSPVSVRATLAAIAGQLDEQDAKGWAATAQAIETITAGPDMEEGIAAFFERRPPRWQAR
jgi:enoyl-CoA hydratase/carnithine racemase